MKKKLILKLLFVCYLFLSVHSVAYADLGWHLVFEHDASGVAITGDVNDLVAAINKGADIKVISEQSDHTYVAEANIIHINKSGSTPIVGIRTSTMISLFKDSLNNYKHQSNAYYVFHIINTTGLVHYSRYLINGSKSSETDLNWPIKWLVRY